MPRVCRSRIFVLSAALAILTTACSKDQDRASFAGAELDGLGDANEIRTLRAGTFCAG